MSAEQMGNPEEQSGASSTDYAKLYEEAHPELEKDRNRAEAMAHASKDSEEEARDMEKLANEMSDAVSDLDELVPEADRDHELRVERMRNQDFAQVIKGEAAAMSQQAEAEAVAGGEAYDMEQVHPELRKVYDPETAYIQAHGEKPLQDEAAKLRAKAAAQDNPTDARLYNELAAHTARGGEAWAKHATQRFEDEDKRISDKDLAYEMAHGGKPVYDEAATDRAKAAEEEAHDPHTAKLRRELAEHGDKVGDMWAEHAGDKYRAMMDQRVTDPGTARTMAEAGKEDYQKASNERTKANDLEAGSEEWVKHMGAGDVAERDANLEAEHAKLLAEEKEKSA
jgi:hypothetical protein